MDDDLLPDPGILSNGDGELPQDSGGGDLQNLNATFPTLSLPPTPPAIMDDSTSDLADSAFTGVPSTGSSNNALDTSLLGFGEGITNSLVGAFVTNPQNAATAEGIADNNAALSLTTSSALFGYLIVGLVIFLIFGAFSSK